MTTGVISPSFIPGPRPIHGVGYRFCDPSRDIAEDSVIESGDFSQLLPNTHILVGKRLVIKGGDWTNVEPLGSWQRRGGIWRSVSYCSHLHPEWVNRGLPRCIAGCKHRQPDGTYQDKEL